MNFMGLAKGRYSVRKFSSRPIEEEKLQRIMEAGRIAPTAKNKQSPHVYVLRSAEAMEKANDLTPSIYGAPVAFLVAYNKELALHEGIYDNGSSGHQDCSIVATHMMLQAWELGVGSCWINRFSPAEAKKAFALPEEEEVVLLMAVGYPAADAEPSERHEQAKSLQKMFTTL